MKALWKCPKCDYSESIDCGHDAGRCVHTHLVDVKSLPLKSFARPLQGEQLPELTLAAQTEHDMKVEKQYSEAEWKAFCNPKK